MKDKSVQKTKIIAVFMLVASILFSITPVVESNGSSVINVQRYEGKNRNVVAETVAKEHFSDSNKVIIVNQDKFPDAISATNVSQGKYPVLYTREKTISQETINTLQKMPLSEIYLLGGLTSISEAVEKKLIETTNIKVTRITGRDRYAANKNAIERNFTQANHVILASGDVYADALYGVSYANTIDAPVVLTRGSQLPVVTVGLLKDLGVQNVTIIGGKRTITEEVEAQIKDLGMTVQQRIAGDNRYIGSAEVATASYTNPEHVIVASGEVFSDALVSAPLAQKLNAPILLVRSNHMEYEVEKYLSNNSSIAGSIYILGGPTTINDSLISLISNFAQSNNKISVEETGVLDITFNQIIFNEEVLKLVNKEREKHGLSQLYYETELQRGVDIRTLDSVSLRTLKDNHSRPDGSEWFTAFNYLNNYSPVYVAGENIAYNSIRYQEYKELSQNEGILEKKIAEMFYYQYVDSLPHYDNMMNSEHEGMAVSTLFADHNSSSYSIRIYNTMVFSNRYKRW